MASEREHIEIGMTTAVKITDEDGVKWNKHFRRDVAFECNSLIVQVRAALSSHMCVQLPHRTGACSSVIVQVRAAHSSCRCVQLRHHAGVCSRVIVQAHALVPS